MLKELKSFKKEKLMVTVLFENQFVECQHKKSSNRTEIGLKNVMGLWLFQTVASKY